MNGRRDQCPGAGRRIDLMHAVMRPRSIARLALIGLPIVLAPLVIAVITAILQVDGLAADSRAAVMEAEKATHFSRQLLQQLGDLRRPYLQYRITGDHDYLAIYGERRGRFLSTVQQLGDVRLTQTASDLLSRLIDQEQLLMDSLSDNDVPFRRSIGINDEEREWLRIDELARSLVAESSQLIEMQANRTSALASDLQQTLLVQATAAIPATLLLATALIILITRPMRVLGEAIRRLGAGHFEQPIKVRGSHEVEELGQQLDWLRNRIVNLEQQKLTFLRHMSHELKTPLTTIREGSDLLAESYADDGTEEAEITEIMRNSSIQLQRLIEDLLLFAKTQEVMADMTLSDDVRLNDIIDTVTADHAVAIAAKNIRLICEPVPATLRGDERKLRIVLDNLLSNAIKYTPPHGLVRISVNVDSRQVVLDVCDSGPGVSASDAARIFEPFFVGCTRHHGSIKGTGLGLSITREYVEAHDGTIEVVQSTTGAHFRVSLPAAGPRVDMG